MFRWNECGGYFFVKELVVRKLEVVGWGQLAVDRERNI